MDIKIKKLNTKKNKYRFGCKKNKSDNTTTNSLYKLMWH